MASTPPVEAPIAISAPSRRRRGPQPALGAGGPHGATPRTSRLGRRAHLLAQVRAERLEPAREVGDGLGDEIDRAQFERQQRLARALGGQRRDHHHRQRMEPHQLVEELRARSCWAFRCRASRRPGCSVLILSRASIGSSAVPTTTMSPSAPERAAQHLADQRGIVDDQNLDAHAASLARSAARGPGRWSCRPAGSRRRPHPDSPNGRYRGSRPAPGSCPAGRTLRPASACRNRSRRCGRRSRRTAPSSATGCHQVERLERRSAARTACGMRMRPSPAALEQPRALGADSPLSSPSG